MQGFHLGLRPRGLYAGSKQFSAHVIKLKKIVNEYCSNKRQAQVFHLRFWPRRFIL